jgi:hypothetical protein
MMWQCPAYLIRDLQQRARRADTVDALLDVLDPALAGTGKRRAIACD